VTQRSRARHRHGGALGLLAAVVVAFVAVVAAESGRSTSLDLPPLPSGEMTADVATVPSPAKPELTARQALGQTIVARFSGTRPPSGFYRRIERGEIGGVILFGDNVVDADQASRLIEGLQRSARRGGNPALLVMTDQEGGIVKRLPGPPTLAPAAMGSVDRARQQGFATGAYLSRVGVGVDLAPVADVGHPGTFLGSRVFGSSPAAVAARACAFAAGLRASGVAATLKHFPGLGWATENTDESPTVVEAPAATIRADYAPYRACGSKPLTLVMMSSARYPSLTGDLPAVMSPPAYEREAQAAGIDALTISDDLEAPPIASETTPARRSIEAGLDLLLYARSEATSAYAYARLLADLEAGRLDRSAVLARAGEVLRLKAELAR
jgi:beta-N-acetylhexosaminidase